MSTLSFRPGLDMIRRGARALAMAATFMLVVAGPSLPREAPKPATAARPMPPTPGIYHLGELRRVEAARLDRSRCFLLQAISPIDLHGGHLPANTSLKLSEAMVEEVARRLLLAKPEWSVVIMPALPVGAGATGEIGAVYFHTSSVLVDMFTFRRLLGAWVLGPGENAYANLSVISFHIDPQHLRAITNACDYFAQNYGMNNLNVMSYLMADSTMLARARALGREALGDVPESELPFELLSGGVAETSLMLYLRPDDVGSEYTELEPKLASSWSDAVSVVKTLGWPGYLGNPARATRDYGQALWDLLADESTALILERMDGSHLVDRPRFEDVIQTDFTLREVIRGNQRVYERHIRRYNLWLDRLIAADKATQGNKSIEP